jgi:hypothetical protein
MKVFALFALVMFALSGCQYPMGKPAKLSSAQSRFARLFAQSRIATEACAGDPDKARAARQSLYAKEGMTNADVRTIVAQIQKEPALWQPFWQAVREYAEAQGDNNGRESRRTDRRKL